MIKATLKKPSNSAATPAGKAVVVNSAPVEVQGVEVESSITAGVPLENLVGGEPATETTSPTAQTEALATRSASAVATRGQYATEGFEGDFGSEDLKFPQVKVVQGSGKLSAMFDEGTIIYADQELVAPPSKKEGAPAPAPLIIVPLHIKKQWRENLSKEAQESGEMPRVVNSIEEVENLGGNTVWVDGQKPSWSPSARCMFLIEQPAGSDHPGFAVELDGKAYAVAIYYAGGMSYNATAKVLFNTALTSLFVPVMDGDKPAVDSKGRAIKRPLLYKNFWSITWTKKPTGNYMTYQPTMRLLKAETGPELRAYAEALTSNTGAGDAAAAAE